MDKRSTLWSTGSLRKVKVNRGDCARVFCATPTTAAVERIFSVTGFIISRRTSLSDEMLEFLLLNHLNGDLRDFGGRVDGRKRKFKDVD